VTCSCAFLFKPALGFGSVVDAGGTDCWVWQMQWRLHCHGAFHGALDDFCTAVLPAACLASLVCWLRPCLIHLHWTMWFVRGLLMLCLTSLTGCLVACMSLHYTHLDDSARSTNQTVSCYCLVSNLVLVAQNAGSVLHKMRHGVPCAHPTAK
jgi:hypothetical protein